MSDEFEIIFNDDWTQFRQRLVTFGEKVTKQVTNKALAETAKMMKESAVNKAHTSEEFIARALASGKPPFFVNEDGTHILKVKHTYIDIKSGNLKKNIRFGKVRKPEENTLQYRVYVKLSIAWYAKFVEFGTSERAPMPFFRPAFEENYQNLSIIFKHMIDELIEQGGF